MVPVLASLTQQLTGSRESFLRSFDLSNNRSLRSLEIEIAPTSNLRNNTTGMGFLRDLLSTITSPAFSDVVIILPDIVVHDARFLQNTLFRVVRDICEEKPFHLVFWLEKHHQDGDADWERLKRMIGVQAAEGRLGPLLHPPVIVPYTRSAQSLESEHLLNHRGVPHDGDTDYYKLPWSR